MLNVHIDIWLRFFQALSCSITVKQNDNYFFMSTEMATNWQATPELDTPFFALEED